MTDPTDAELEAAAKAMYDSQRIGGDQAWGQVHPGRWNGLARAAWAIIAPIVRDRALEEAADVMDTRRSLGLTTASITIRAMKAKP